MWLGIGKYKHNEDINNCLSLYLTIFYIYTIQIIKLYEVKYMK